MADEPEKEEGKGFKVRDRRRFTDDGEAREEGGDDEQKAAETSGAKESQATRVETGEADTEPRDLPPINFSTFIISLSTQALMLLGEISDPETGVAQKDVEVAKQTIDIIAMLAEKCRGNLDDSEERLLKEVLYNLRMRYVEVVRQK